MTDIEPITLGAEILDEEAARDIEGAVSARHSIARKYVRRLRRRHPDATPVEVIRMLERHYATSINTAGAVITAGVIAADVGIAMIPVAGAAAAGAKAVGQQAAKGAAKGAAKVAAKEVAKTAGKNLLLGTAKNGAGRLAAMLPAGDQQLQFEITAIFGLAIADIHGMNLDKDQAQALVYGLTNERVSQRQIATMAADIAKESGKSTEPVAADGPEDWSHWASTLADALPAGGAQSLVRTVQTGQLNTLRDSLDGKQQATVEYGVGALVDGVARFVFGREAINAARAAFPPAPEVFPAHLGEALASEDDADEQNRAFAALEDAAKATGGWIADAAGAVGSGVANGAVAVGTGVASAAGTATRVFRSVDLDGDGIPDEPQALSAVKGVGSTVAGVAGTVGGRMAGLFKSKKGDATNASTADPVNN